MRALAKALQMLGEASFQSTSITEKKSEIFFCKHITFLNVQSPLFYSCLLTCFWSFWNAKKSYSTKIFICIHFLKRSHFSHCYSTYQSFFSNHSLVNHEHSSSRFPSYWPSPHPSHLLLLHLSSKIFIPRVGQFPQNSDCFIQFLSVLEDTV